MLYKTTFSKSQIDLLKAVFAPLSKAMRKHDSIDILEAIHFVVYTGCQWRMLPPCYPPWPTVYYHFRCWSETDCITQALRILVMMKRQSNGQNAEPSMAVIDSQSVRIGLPHSESGVDGGKRVKGIKRHIMVDKNGYVLSAYTTTANIHDTKGAIPLITNCVSAYGNIRTIKADLGYQGTLKGLQNVEFHISMECVKSNHGTSKFIPIDGRWVVERTFSWLQNYRRLMRNYEQYLTMATTMTLLASVFFMLRYF